MMNEDRIVALFNQITSSLEPLEEMDCSYLPDARESLKGVMVRGMPNGLHSLFIQSGFRHSGNFFYLPACSSCRACLPLRVPVAMFKASKKQRHIWNKNSDIEVRVMRPMPSPEKYEMYCRYLAFQHAKAKEETDGYDSFRRFLYMRHESSAEIEYWLDEHLVGITIADIIPGGALSSVYHFFDPAYASRSIGVFSVLAEIRLCSSYDIPYYYLGFWIKACRKMVYKAQYRPNEVLLDGQWVMNPYIE